MIILIFIESNLKTHDPKQFINVQDLKKWKLLILEKILNPIRFKIQTLEGNYYEIV